MQVVVLIARFLLFGVFAVAGLAKLFDRAGSRQALAGFGVPVRFAAPLGILLPLAELVTAAAIIPAASARAGALAALFLLLLFVLGISVNLVLGRTPDCHCFGQLHSAPVSCSTLGRNAALACVAGFVVWGARHNPEVSFLGWILNLTPAQQAGLALGIACIALLVVQCAVLVQVLRQQGRLLLRLDAVEARLVSGGLPAMASPATGLPQGLPPGMRAPGFKLMSLDGGFVTLSDLLVAKKPALLLFTNPKCGPCQALAPDLTRWQREYSSTLSITLISEGSVKDNKWEGLGDGMKILLQNKREIAEAYQAHGTPAAVLIQSDGNVGSFLAQGADAIRMLVGQTLSPPSPTLRPVLAGNGGESGRNGNGNGTDPAYAPKIGEPAPSLKFRDLSGRAVTLKKLRGRRTLLLFWNPECGFCQQMLNDLRAWEHNKPQGAPELLVVSTGTTEVNRAMNLRSRVVLDTNFQAGRTFGANGTPMAILLGPDGRVASEVVAGAAAVFGLATLGFQPAG
jgi:thiol-disulfide isomerase/thioredoxin